MTTLDIKSYIKDHKVEAVNVLVELSVGDYLRIAQSILDDNEFQRKRVIKSTVSRQLKADLQTGCTMPSIILAISEEIVDHSFNYEQAKETHINKIVSNAFDEHKLLIIDGLQRTNILIELARELKKNDNVKDLERLKKQMLRFEVYVGIDKLGILYRMITLNTGQQTMSLRHLMEILYIDYVKMSWNGSNIKLLTQKDRQKIPADTTHFSFKDVLDGFNAYLIGSEQLLTKVGVLSNIKNIKKISEIREKEQDTFKDFVLTYQHFLEKVNATSKDWSYHKDQNGSQEYQINYLPFGKTAIEIFKKSQPMSGFGATLHILSKSGVSFVDINKTIDKLVVGEDSVQESFENLLKQLDTLRDESKRLGSDQRKFFKFFFKSLLSPNGDNIGQFDEAIAKTTEEMRLELEWA